ncbi:unnamed protein product [Colias eurytheme]|nr:unnamed protein product [Colias eurytheme]
MHPNPIRQKARHNSNCHNVVVCSQYIVVTQQQLFSSNVLPQSYKYKRLQDPGPQWPILAHWNLKARLGEHPRNPVKAIDPLQLAGHRLDPTFPDLW